MRPEYFRRKFVAEGPPHQPVSICHSPLPPWPRGLGAPRATSELLVCSPVGMNDINDLAGIGAGRGARGTRCSAAPAAARQRRRPWFLVLQLGMNDINDLAGLAPAEGLEAQDVAPRRQRPDSAADQYLPAFSHARTRSPSHPSLILLRLFRWASCVVVVSMG